MTNDVPYHSQEVWPKLTNLKWIHSIAVGVDTMLFDELVNSDVGVTNSRVRG